MGIRVSRNQRSISVELDAGLAAALWAANGRRARYSVTSIKNAGITFTIREDPDGVTLQPKKSGVGIWEFKPHHGATVNDTWPPTWRAYPSPILVVYRSGRIRFRLPDPADLAHRETGVARPKARPKPVAVGHKDWAPVGEPAQTDPSYTRPEITERTVGTNQGPGFAPPPQRLWPPPRRRWWQVLLSVMRDKQS